MSFTTPPVPFQRKQKKRGRQTCSQTQPLRLNGMMEDKMFAAPHGCIFSQPGHTVSNTSLSSKHNYAVFLVSGRLCFCEKTSFIIRVATAHSFHSLLNLKTFLGTRHWALAVCGVNRSRFYSDFPWLCLLHWFVYPWTPCLPYRAPTSYHCTTLWWKYTSFHHPVSQYHSFSPFFHK